MKPLRVHSVAEARLYLMVTPCPKCSSGPWETMDSEEIQAEESQLDETSEWVNLKLYARCLKCGYRQEFLFRRTGKLTDIERELQKELHDSEIDLVNPFPEHSEVIDLGQWLSLFYMLVEKASSSVQPEQTRRFGFQAAQCLEEALKFYKEGDELPPASAFFVESSRRAYGEHPEKFTKRRLIDMRSKLPDLRVMIKKLARDTSAKPSKRWWRFWKR